MQLIILMQPNGLKKIYHMQKFQVGYQIYLSHLEEITQ